MRTGLTAEYIKQWYEQAMEMDKETRDSVNPEAVTLWEKVLEIVGLVFEEGEIPQAFGPRDFPPGNNYTFPYRCFVFGGK